MRGNSASPTHRSIHGHSIVYPAAHSPPSTCYLADPFERQQECWRTTASDFVLLGNRPPRIRIPLHQRGTLRHIFSRRGRRQRGQAQALRALRHAVAPTWM